MCPSELSIYSSASLFSPSFSLALLLTLVCSLAEAAQEAWIQLVSPFLPGSERQPEETSKCVPGRTADPEKVLRQIVPPSEFCRAALPL